jgi:glycine C-acetyltransferase
VLDLISNSSALRDRLRENTKYFREGLKSTGLTIIEGEHPIVPVMLYDEILAQKMAEKLLDKGIYAIGFFYPVVPKGRARVRCQISAGHTKSQLDIAIEAFARCKEELGI